MPWIQLAIAVVFFVIGELLRPKPKYEDAQATPFAEARIPQVDPQRKQAVIWGKVDLRSPHVMDVTEYTPLPIKKKVSTSMFSSEKVIVGYRYFVGMQLGLCSQATTLHKVFYDDREVISGTYAHADTGTAIAINLPNFLGGREKGGGIIGTMRFFGASTTQMPSTYLTPFQTPCPAYRTTSHVVLENVEIGESPDLSGIGFQLSRYPDPLAFGAGGNIIGVDINPISVIVDIFTNTDYGYGLPISGLSAATFTAAATTLKAEGNGISLKWTQNESLSNLIDTICRQVDGVMRYNPSTGLWEFKLVREDYTVGTLPVLNNTNVKELLSYSRASWDETFNQVEINYSKRDSTEQPSPALAEDRSNFIRQNRNKLQSMTFPGVYDATLAQAIAARTLYRGAFPLATIELTVNRTAWNLLPGDTFVFAWPELGITQLVFRIASMSFGDNEQTEINITAIEDIFKISSAIFTTPPVSLYVPIAAVPAQVTVAKSIDAPYVFNVFDDSATIPGVTNKPLTLVATPQGNAQNYQIYQRIGANAYDGDNYGDYLPTGTLNAALAEGTADTVTSIVVNNVSRTGLLSATAVATATIKSQRLNLCLIVHATLEPEWVAYESLTIAGSTVTMNNVHRGLLDSLATPHLAAERVWFVSGANIPGPGTTAIEYTDTQLVDLQFENNTAQGVGTMSANFPVTMRNRVERPYPGGNFVVNSIRYPTLPFALNSALLFTWFHRPRTLGNPLLFQDDANNSATVEQIPTPMEYVLKIYNNAGPTLVRTVKTTGGNDTLTTNNSTSATYNYTLAKQQADGGPFSSVRIVLTVQDLSTGLITNITDVVRVFSVVIPVNLQGRGHVYNAVALAGPQTFYPINAVATPYPTTIGVGGSNATDSGTVGDGGPGPEPLTYSPFLPGTVGNAINIPDGIVNYGANHCESIWFRIVNDTQTTRTIIIKDTADAAPTRAHTFEVRAGGLLAWDRGGSDQLVEGGSPALNFEDGRWHHALLRKGSGGSFFMMVDGQMLKLLGASDTTAVTNTDALRIGAVTTGTQKGYARAFITQYALWNTSVPTGHQMQQLFADALLVQYTMARLTMAYGFQTFLRGNVGETTNPHELLNLGDDTAGVFGSGSPGFGTTDTWQIGNTSTASGGMQRATNVEDDPGFRAWQTINAGFTLKQRGPNNVFNGRSNSGSGSKEFTFWAYYQPNATPTEPHCLFSVAGSSESTNDSLYKITIQTNGKIRVFMNLPTGNTRQWETTNAPVATFGGVWYHIMVTNLTTTGKAVYVNGIEYALTITTAGTPPATDDWVNNRGGNTSLMDTYLVGATQNTDEPRGDVAAMGYLAGVCLTKAQVILHYANFLRAFPSFKEEALWSFPENFIMTDSATSTDLRSATLGAPTLTGTLPTDEEMSPVSDDSLKPIRFSGTQRLRYTGGQLLASKGTGALHDFAVMVVGQMFAIGVDETLVCNGPAGGASTNRNLDVFYDTSGTAIAFQTSDALMGTGVSVTTHKPFAVVFKEKTSGGNAYQYWNDVVMVNNAAAATAYTGAACVEANIGSQGGLTLPANGIVPYVVTWARYIPSRLIRRLQLRYRGMVGHALEIHQYIDKSSPDLAVGWMFPLDERETLSFQENWIVNDQTLIQNLTRTGASAVVKTGITIGHWRATQFNDTQWSEAPSRFTNTSSPIVMGGWFRVDSGTDALISVGRSDVTTKSLSVGIIGNKAGIRMHLTSSTATIEQGTTTIPNGTWAHIVMVAQGAADRKLYINGVLEASFTTNYNLDANVVGCDVFAVNKVVGNGTTFFGSYQWAWGINNAPTMVAADVRAIYASTQQDISWQLARAYAAVAYWPLNDYVDATGIFHDRINATYGAVQTGISYPVAGVIPSRPDNAVAFDGTGKIDTTFKGYQTGSAVRGFSMWLSQGFTGTVFSMGANTDANALVVSVDGSGDVSINIRGASNLRKYTTALDTGGVHHLFIALPTGSTTLQGFKVYIDGVDQTTIGTAGNNTTLATTATLNLTLGSDVTDIATGDATGTLQAFTVYNTALSADQINTLYLGGIAKQPGIL